MEHRLLMTGKQFHSPETEARLTYFADGKVERSERLKEAQKRIDDERKVRIEASGNASDRLNTKRLNAPLVDEDRAEALLDFERASFLLEDTPESRRYKGAVQKAQYLEQKYQTQLNKEKKAVIQGITFGAPGGELTVTGADEKFVGWALEHIAAQQKENLAPPADPATDHPYNPDRESLEEYNARMTELRKDSAEGARSLRERGGAENNEWNMLYSALSKWNSKFAFTKNAKEQIARNPARLNDLFTDAWKKDNPKEYKATLLHAAEKDASVLSGKGNEFSPTDFLSILNEAKTKNPMVLEYYSEANKEKYTSSYRSALIEGAKVNAQVIAIAVREFDKFWKDAPADFVALVKNAVTQDPLLILQPALWKKGDTPPVAADLASVLTPPAKLKVLGAMNAGNIALLGVDLPVQLARGVYSAEKNKTIIAIVRNPVVAKAIASRDKAFFDQVVEELFLVLSEDERAQLQGVPYYEELRKYAEHTLRLEMGKALLGDKDPNRIVRFLNADPALREWAAVKAEWLSDTGKALPKQAQVQMKAIIARNLYFQNLTVTEANVKREEARVEAARSAYRGVKLFAGRKVLHVAHSEKWKDGSHRFGTDAVRDAIQAQAGKDAYKLIRPENTKESLKKAKEEILVRIAKTQPPFTMIFEGHGSPSAIYLFDGEHLGDQKTRETSNTIKITVDELAAALLLRAELFFPEVGDPDPARKDILVFGSCFNTNFIRGLHERLRGVPKPIVLGSSEFGQYGYSDKKNAFGSPFTSEVLQLKDKGHTTTFGDIFDHEFDGLSNPSLYVPDVRNTTQQVTQKKGPEKAEGIV